MPSTYSNFTETIKAEVKLEALSAQDQIDLFLDLFNNLGVREALVNCADAPKEVGDVIARALRKSLEEKRLPPFQQIERKVDEAVGVLHTLFEGRVADALTLTQKDAVSALRQLNTDIGIIAARNK